MLLSSRPQIRCDVHSVVGCDVKGGEGHERTKWLKGEWKVETRQ